MAGYMRPMYASVCPRKLLPTTRGRCPSLPKMSLRSNIRHCCFSYNHGWLLSTVISHIIFIVKRKVNTIPTKTHL